MTVRFDNRVAIVTGAGGGLGRQYALDLAARGVKVVVNDLGGTLTGGGGSPVAAQKVVDEITASGGEAMASGASVSDQVAVGAMVDAAIARFGKIDILINNAGILRDKTFAKMEIDDFRAVLDVHLMGSVICTKAVWDHMRDNGFGRILMTTSSSGLYGNFGQSNYAAAKMGLVGLMKTLALEGARNHVHVNAIAPLAATRMTENLMPPEVLARIQPHAVSPAALYLVSDDAPTGRILNAGGGGFESAHVTLTPGIHVEDSALMAETVAARIGEICDRTAEMVPDSGLAQGQVAIGGARPSR